MIKETNATKEYLKAVTGKFDLETIFVLNLKEKNLNKMNSILLCVNLTLLNLSNNKLTNVRGIGVMKELKFLDLSYNLINNIDDLEYLTNLKSLKLQGNKIEFDKNFVQKFRFMNSLDKLSFQEFDMNKKSQNPICKIENYRKEIFSIFANLKYLDSTRKECEGLTECFNVKEKENLFNMFEVKKINLNEYDFDFRESKKIFIIDVEIDLLTEKNFFTGERFEGIKQSLDDRYNMFQKELEGILQNLN